MKRFIGVMLLTLVACGARGAKVWSEDVNFIQPLEKFEKEVNDQVGSTLLNYWSQQRANTYMHLYVQFDESRDSAAGEASVFAQSLLDAPKLSVSQFIDKHPTTPPEYKDILRKLANVETLKFLKTKENRNIFLNELGKYIFGQSNDKVKTLDELLGKLDLTRSADIPVKTDLKLAVLTNALGESFIGKIAEDTGLTLGGKTPAGDISVVKLNTAKMTQLAEKEEADKAFKGLSNALGSIALAA